MDDCIVQIVAPVGRDGELLAAFLGKEGVPSACPDLLTGMHERERDSSGPLLIAEEALTPALIQHLGSLLHTQPSWSDLPILVLIPSGRETQQSLERQRQRLPLGHLTLLERPLRPASLLSAVHAALRARQRQYQVRNAERALMQSEKLAAVGRLASSIAHEINNPLEAVTNLLYLARLTTKDPEVEQYLETADQELRRVSVIASQTLRFHRQATLPLAVTAQDLFSTVLSIYEGRLRNSSIQVETDFRARHPIVCFEGDVRQVLNNLVGNAVDAMSQGGRLLIRSHEVQAHEGRRPGMVLTVADTGSGMTPSTSARIFEPFYTTKGIGGTGLGLWVSKEVVARHNGTLVVRSTQGPPRSGTVFRLFLPKS